MDYFKTLLWSDTRPWCEFICAKTHSKYMVGSNSRTYRFKRLLHEAQAVFE